VKRSTGLVVSLALGIALGLVLFAGLGVVTVVAAPADSVSAPDLRAHLLAAPKGSQPWEQPPGKDEHLSLDEAAQRSDNPGSLAAELKVCHFQDGAVRAWRESDGTLVEIRLLARKDEVVVWLVVSRLANTNDGRADRLLKAQYDRL
jgi:hypothetical protein